MSNLPKTEPAKANLPKTEPAKANLPATSPKAKVSPTAASTVMTNRAESLAPNERKVVQYGPAWVEHVTAGGALRSGQILID